MENEENELEKERSGGPALYVYIELIDIYAIIEPVEAPPRDGTTSLIWLMTWLVVQRGWWDRSRCRPVRSGRDLGLVSQPQTGREKFIRCQW